MEGYIQGWCVVMTGFPQQLINSYFPSRKEMEGGDREREREREIQRYREGERQTERERDYICILRVGVQMFERFVQIGIPKFVDKMQVNP